MKKALLIALAVLLICCVGVEKNETVSVVKVSKMPYLKQVVIMNVKGNYRAILFFEFPNPCHKIRLKEIGFRGNEVTISLKYTPPKPGTYCIQVLKRENITVDLGRLAEGEYTVLVKVNGSIVKVLKFRV